MVDVRHKEYVKYKYIILCTLLENSNNDELTHVRIGRLVDDKNKRHTHLGQEAKSIFRCNPAPSRFGHEDIYTYWDTETDKHRNF